MTGIFETEYADTYDIVYREKNYAREVAAIGRLFERYKADPIKSVLDLGCGTGRHAVLLARSGLDVVGVDQSDAMLEHARKLAQDGEPGHSPTFIKGDIRDFELEQQVDLVICPFRSLMHLPTWHDKRRVFERVADALRPGGRFAWNAFAFSHLIAASIHGRRIERRRPVIV